MDADHSSKYPDQDMSKVRGHLRKNFDIKGVLTYSEQIDKSTKALSSFIMQHQVELLYGLWKQKQENTADLLTD